MTRTNTMAKSRNTESRELNNRGQSMEYTEPNMIFLKLSLIVLEVRGWPFVGYV